MAIPQRKCVGCRKVRPQPDLFRLAAENGRVVPGKVKPGRGCWLCREEACVRMALKTGQIRRALKADVKVPEVGDLLQWMGLVRLTANEGAD